MSTVSPQHCLKRKFEEFLFYSGPEYGDERRDKPFVDKLPDRNPSDGKPTGSGASIFGKPRAGHCTEKDCCECGSVQQSSNGSSHIPNEEELREMKEQNAFENALHNYVFTKK